MRQHTNGFRLDAVQQFLEQLERFTLVFLFRVFLTITAQVNALTQVIHGRQVFFPEVVQNLQHHLFFKGSQCNITHCFFFRCIVGFNRFQNALTQDFFVEFVVFFQPLLDWQLNIELGLQMCFQPRNIPLLFQALRRNTGIDSIVHNVFTDVADHTRNVVHRHQVVTLVVDHGTLVVCHVIVFQQLLTNIEVTAFNLALCFLNSVGDHFVFNGLTVFHTQ